MYLKSNSPLKDLAYKRTDATVPLIFQIKQENFFADNKCFIKPNSYYVYEILFVLEKKKKVTSVYFSFQRKRNTGL